MKNISKKKSGFTLLEVIISIAIISILSVGIYNGYMLLVKVTKSGEARQAIAINGKKSFESISSSITLKEVEGEESLSFNLDEKNIKLPGNIDTEKFDTKLYLDNNYNIIENENGSRYTEIITINKVKGKIDGTDSYVNVDLDKKISNIDNPLDIDVDYDDLTDNIFNIYIEEEKEGNIKVNNNSYKDNIILNLSRLTSSNNIKINVSNETENIPNIYIKSKDNLNIDFKVTKGTVSKKIYKSSSDEKSILYNVNIKIVDNTDNTCIFKGNNRISIPITQN
ncbi:prepilin-type N-terminal cleavage/methylation domain-containing protein [Clostridium neonatale]|uniref:prepilin-type N-terminal cleavage/methylation domain-containing protein n=1 Tax=Clostridium neonatale TaxID=137838 RepID=UPI00291B5A05|nr:prepilin-type N-terminal cleavage/methylation domain-containing protein [Clostridium neonatale]CAI3208097.1 Prepilin-type cleavage/methylation domain-containing protein [Clostridium neonatale]